MLIYGDHGLQDRGRGGGGEPGREAGRGHHPHTIQHNMC